MSFKVGQLENFPKEVVNVMLDYQVAQGNKRKIKVFQKNNEANQSEKGFDWDLTSEREAFWHNVIMKEDFNLFFKRYPKDNGHQAVYRMNRKGIFLPAKHTENQCGKQGN